MGWGASRDPLPRYRLPWRGRRERPTTVARPARSTPRTFHHFAARRLRPRGREPRRPSISHHPFTPSLFLSCCGTQFLLPLPARLRSSDLIPEFRQTPPHAVLRARVIAGPNLRAEEADRDCTQADLRLQVFAGQG